jgi:hypothetical protein
MGDDVPVGRWSKGWFAAGVVCIVLFHEQATSAKELLPLKEQESTEIGVTKRPSFDDQEKGVPQSLFTWIKMARGFEVEWDTFGRTGWYTQDPRLTPIEPGSIFTPETPAIYIVFEVAPLEDPAQFAVQWYQEQPSGQQNERPLGQDVLEVPGHERYGYLELKRSGTKWTVGNYQAKVYIAPLGQQPFHAVNHVGTMRFSVVADAPTVAPERKSVR